MERSRSSRNAASVVGKAAGKMRTGNAEPHRANSTASTSAASPSLRTSKVLPAVPPSGSSSTGSSLQSSTSKRPNERDFEEVLSSGRTLVITPGPRETLLASDSDLIDDYDHLELDEKEANKQRAVHQQVTAPQKSRRNKDAPVEAGAPPARGSRHSKERIRSRHSTEGAAGSSDGKDSFSLQRSMQPLPGEGSVSHKANLSKTTPSLPPVHPSSNENSIDTIMNNMPTPTGKQFWPPRTPTSPTRSSLRSSPGRTASATTDSPKQTPPRASGIESSPVENVEALPIHPHQRTSFKSPKGDASSLGGRSNGSSVMHSPAIPSVHVQPSNEYSLPIGRGTVVADSSEVKVPARATSIERAVTSIHHSPATPKSTSPQRSKSASQTLSPRNASTAMGASPSVSANTSKTSREEESTPAKSISGQQRPLRTRLKVTGKLLRRLGGNNGATSKDDNDSQTDASSYAREVQRAAALARVQGKDEPLDLQKKVSPGNTSQPDAAKSRASPSAPKQSQLLDASASSTTVSSISSSGTSASVDYRKKLAAWERSVDDALEPANSDLNKKMQIRAPSKNWTPSPQLPEYKLNRKGSFMDDGAGNDPFASFKHEATATRSLSLQSGDGSDRDPATPRGGPTPTLSVPGHGPGSVPGSGSGSVGGHGLESVPIETSVQKPVNSTVAAKEATSTISMSPEEKGSLYTVQSYETANDRPSLAPLRARTSLINAQDTRQPLQSAVTPSTTPTAVLEKPDDETLSDPEQSIRLVPARQSTKDADASTDAALPGLEPDRIAAAGHLAQSRTGSAASKTSQVPSVPPKEEVWGAAGAVLGQELATKCWTEDESFKKRERIAEWLGSDGQLNAAARQMYFDKFDFENLSIEAALRKLCDKLYLRAETQQIDRILLAFSKRYHECNPTTLFATVDIIHAVSFSILLLNTDLHVAELDQRMTRQQFVRNTLDAILESGDVPQDLQDAAATLATDTASQAHAQTISKSVADDIEAALKEIYTAVKLERIRLPLPETAAAPSSTRKSRMTASSRVNAFKRGSIRGVQGLMGTSLTHSFDGDEDPVKEFRPESPLGGSRPSMESGLARSALGLHSMKDFNTRDTSAIGFTGSLNHNTVKERPGEEDASSLNSATDEPDDDELALLGAPWGKEGLLTRKHFYEAPQKRAREKGWVECFVVVQKGLLSMFKFGENASSSSASKSQQGVAMGGGNWLSNATCIGQLPLAHALADVLPSPGYNRARPHVFALTLASGNVYLFQAGHEELVAEWVTTCNYWAARLSREPLAAGVSNMEYGWNRVQPDMASSADKSHELDDGGSEAHSTNGKQVGDDENAPAHPNSHYFSALHGPRKNSSDTRSIRSTKSGRLRSVTTSFLPARRPSDRSSFDKVISPGNSSYSDVTSPAASLGSFNAATTPGSSSGRAVIERPHFVNEWRPPAPPTTASTLSEDDQLEACLRHTARIEAELTMHNSLRQPMIDMFKGGPAGMSMDGLSSSSGALSPTASTISLPPAAAASSLRGRSGLGRTGGAESGGSRASRSAASANAVLASKAMANWERKSAYLLAELTKTQVYVESLRSASRLRAERRDQRLISRMMRKADEDLREMQPLATKP